MTINWLRKKHLKVRYGKCSYRTLGRMIEDGRLPPPEYPFGNSIEAWREDVLDAHDLAAAAAAKSAGRPVRESAAKTAPSEPIREIAPKADSAPVHPRAKSGKPQLGGRVEPAEDCAAAGNEAA